MHNRLIVGYDGSDASIHALEWAAAAAESRGASVRVISSYAAPPLVDFGYGSVAAVWADDDIPEWTRAELDRAVTKAFEHRPAVAHDYQAVSTRPGAALLSAAKEADLIVVGSSGAGAISRMILGSVTSEVLASSPCPVVVAPSKVREATNRVVVGTDGSDHSASAVEWAAAEAKRRGSDLVIVHAWEPPHRQSVDAKDRHTSSYEVDAQLVLDGAVDTARGFGVASVEATLVDGGTAQSLLDLAESADLIVVGSRGRGGFRSMLFGSVAHAIAAHSPCPAVIVR